jgi:hypothetical protein
MSPKKFIHLLKYINKKGASAKNSEWQGKGNVVLI